MFPTIEEDHPHLRPNLPPRRTTQPQPQPEMSNLIDLNSSSDEEGPQVLKPLRRTNSDTKAETEGHRASIASTKSAPPPPRKPVALRSSSQDSSAPSSPSSTSKPPPPKPRRPSSTVHQPSPLAQQSSTQSPTTPSRPQPGPKPTFDSQQTYAGMARDKLTSVYNNLPALRSTYAPNYASREATNTSETDEGTKKEPPPPPPPRRNVTAYPSAAASYVGGKAVSAWQHAPNMPHTSGQATHFSTTSSPQQPQRTNTSSTLGTNGGYGNGNGNGNGAGEGMNKRELMWRQRWSRAEHILADDGVVLRTWRVGTDVVGEAERLIREVTKSEGKGKVDTTTTTTKNNGGR